MKRFLAVGIVLIALVPGVGHAQSVGPEPYPHGIGFGAGLHVFLLEDTPLGEMIRNYGLDVLGTGPAFTLSYDQRVLPWLSLGGTLAVRYSEGRQSPLDAGIRSPNSQGSEAGLYMLTPRIFARPSFYIPDNGVDGSALEMGIELSIGAGATLLGWRGVTDVAAHFELAAALLWSVHIGCWAATLRIIHQGLWQEGLGPLDVGFGPTWMPTIDLRLEKRW